MVKEYNLIFTPEEVSYLGQVLGERPFKEVNIFIQKIQAQVLEIDSKSKSVE